jgi:beta-lactamase regulating signal transducer with metallopeptidase domain
MNPLDVLSSHPIFHRLAVALVEFLWQGALVAALWAAAHAMLARARPSARYALGCAALLAMVAFPCWTFCHTSGESTRPLALVRGAARIGTATHSSDPSSPATTADSSHDRPVLPRALRGLPDSIEPWPVAIWAAGVLLLCLRFFTRWAAVGRLKRGARAPESPTLHETLARIARRMRISRPVRLLESAAIRVPAALGVLRPAILLPLSGLTGLSSAQIEALLAHELAHVRRHDYLVNLFQTAVETLLFYHPAVWWISRQVRLERENCCDDLAIAATGDARVYARALLRLEEERASVPLAVAATGATLLPRIARLFPRHPARRTNPAHAGAFLALAALVTLGAAARGHVSPPEVFSGGGAGFSLPVSTLADMEASVGIGDDSAPRPAPRLARASAARAAESAMQASAPSSAKDSRAGAITAEDLEDFRTHGVTADFIRDIEALGYTHASAATLISLRVHGVSPDFLRGLNEVFAERISLDTAVDLRIHGVGADFVKEMSSVFGRLSPDTAESLRIHGVSPEYVARFRDQGYSSLSADEAITMRNHGVDAGAAAEFVKMGFPKPSLDELLVARNHGVSVEYVRGIRDAGLAVLDLDVMVSLRKQGVTPEYLKAIRALGFSKISADEASALRNHGVTSDFLSELRAAGYTGLSVDEAVALRNHGITADFARKANASVVKRLSVDELIDSRRWRRSDP